MATPAPRKESGSARPPLPPGGAAPAKGAARALRAEFRPPLIKEEDTFFWIVLLVLFAIAVPLFVWLRTLPAPAEEPEQAAIERYASLIIPEQPKIKDATKTPAGAGKEQKEEKDSGEGKDEGKGKGKDEGTSQGDKDKEAGRKISREELKKRVSTKGLLGLITGRGNRPSAVADVLRGGGLGMSLDSALKGVTGLEVARTASDIKGTRGGGGGGKGGGALDIGKLKAVEGKGVGLGEKKASKVPQITLPDAQSISGEFDANTLRQGVERARTLVKMCYEDQLKRDPTLQGKIVVRFVIGEDGGVTSSEIASSTFDNKDFEGCLLRVIRRLHFPKPKGGAVTVEYPFVLSPAAG